VKIKRAYDNFTYLYSFTHSSTQYKLFKSGLDDHVAVVQVFVQISCLMLSHNCCDAQVIHEIQSFDNFAEDEKKLVTH